MAANDISQGPIPSSGLPVVTQETSTDFATHSSSVVGFYANPYHLHHLDSTNLVLVSDLLTETNYNSRELLDVDRVIMQEQGWIHGWNSLLPYR